MKFPLAHHPHPHFRMSAEITSLSSLPPSSPSLSPSDIQYAVNRPYPSLLALPLSSSLSLPTLPHSWCRQSANLLPSLLPPSPFSFSPSSLTTTAQHRIAYEYKSPSQEADFGLSTLDNVDRILTGETVRRRNWKGQG